MTGATPGTTEQRIIPHTIHTAAKEAAFFEALAKYGNVYAACRVSGYNRKQVYDKKEKDPDFFQKFKDAEAANLADFEVELKRRAVDGINEPIVYKGEIIGYRKKHSDNLMMFSLSALHPEKYRQKFDVTGSVQHNHKAELPEAVLSILDSLKAVNVTPPPCPDPQVIECQEHQPGEFGAIPENTFGAIQCDSIATLPEVGAINSEVWRDSGAIQEGSLRDSGAIIPEVGAIIPKANDPQSDQEPGSQSHPVSLHDPHPAGWKVRKVEGQTQSHQATVKVRRYVVE